VRHSERQADSGSAGAIDNSRRTPYCVSLGGRVPIHFCDGRHVILSLVLVISLALLLSLLVQERGLGAYGSVR